MDARLIVHIALLALLVISLTSLLNPAFLVNAQMSARLVLSTIQGMRLEVDAPAILLV